MMVARLLGALLALAATVQLLAVEPARGAMAARGHVMLVLDSTAYMRGLFGSDSKLVAVSNAMSSVLPAYETRIDAGLMIYGHHMSGPESCPSHDQLRPVAPFTTPALTDVLATLKTKGDAPVAGALAAAAKDPALAGGNGTLILIAGGPDSCQADPCAAAAQIASEHGLLVHVIAIDTGNEGEGLRRLKCVADQTGGTFWQVGSTMELAAALDDALAAAVQRAGGGGSSPGVAGMRPSDGGAGETGMEAGESMSLDTAALPAGPRQTIALSALLTDAGPQLTSGLRWSIFKMPPKPGAQLQQVASSGEATPSVGLPDGDYIVNVAYGRAYLTRKISVTADAAVDGQFVLNAGGLRIAARLANGDAIPATSIVGDIFSDERDQLGNRTKVAAGIRPGIIVRLNAGLYHVAALYGDANAVVQTDIGVEAGKVTEAAFSFTAPKVSFRLVQQQGGEALAGTSWTIQAAGTGEVVKESQGALATHVLAAGNYTVVAERGGKKFTQDFTVAPGTPLQVEVIATSE